MLSINRKSIGIDIADHSIEIAELGGQRGSVRVLSLGRVVLAPGVIVNGRVKDPEKLEKAFRILFESAKPHPIKPTSVYLGLPEKQVFTHCFLFDSKNKNDEDAIVGREARTMIPIDEVNLVYAYELTKTKSLGQNGKEVVQNKAVIAAADREVIIEWEEFFKRFKISILGFDIESYAVYRGLFDKNPEYPVCVVDIGSATTNIYLYSEGSLCYSHTINKGGERFTRNIAEIRKSADGATIGMIDAEVLKVETGLLKTGQYKDEIYLVLSNALRSILAEIKTALDYYKEKTQKNVMKIVLVGGSSRMKGILDFFTINMQAPVAITPEDGGLDRSSEKDKFVIEIGKSAYIESPAALQYIEAIGIAVRGVEKSKYKNIPLLTVKKNDKKDSFLGKFKKESINANDLVVDEEAGVKKAAWIKTHPKEFQLLMILLLGAITIGWAFWYRAHNNGRIAQTPIFESNSFDYPQERLRVFPVAIDSSEYTDDRIKGRIAVDTVAVATALNSALAESKSRMEMEKKRGEALWPNPLNMPEENSSIVFPLKLEWLFFSEADIKNLHSLDIKKIYSEEFLFDKLEYAKLEATANKSVYNLTTIFYFLTAKDFPEEKSMTEIATTSEALLEIGEKVQKKTEDGFPSVEKNETSDAELTMEELQQALRSAKGAKKEGFVTILETSVGWLNARSGPGTDNPVLKTLSPGETYLLLEEKNNWLKLDLGNDLVGWVSADYVEK